MPNKMSSIEYEYITAFCESQQDPQTADAKQNCALLELLYLEFSSTGLASDWHWIGIRLALDWHWIGMGFASDWHWSNRNLEEFVCRKFGVAHSQLFRID